MDQIRHKSIDQEKKNPLSGSKAQSLLSVPVLELTAYVIVGALTTGVYFFSYAVLKLIGINYMVNSCLSWTAAVLFAFFANKYFVFRSMRASDLIQEMLRFFGARIVTLLIDLLVTWSCIELLRIGEWKTKVFSQIVVMVLNYVFSKLVVFRRGQKESNRPGQ